MLVGRASDHGHADFLRDLVAHLREARAGYQKGNAHLRSLDHHFGGEAARGVEDLVVSTHVVEPHLTGDGVHRVVTADVFDEHQNVGDTGLTVRVVGGQRAAV